MYCEKSRPKWPKRILIVFFITFSLFADTSVFAETAQGLAEKAQNLDKDGFYQEAAATWEKVLKAKPGSETETLARLKLSSTYMKIDQPTQALASIQKLIESKPDHFDAQFHLANMQAKMKNFPAAIQAFEKTIALRPDEGLGYVGLALCLFGNGNPDAAIDRLKVAKKIFKKKKNISWYRDARIAISQIKGFAIYPPSFADLWLANNLELVRNTYENTVFLHP